MNTNLHNEIKKVQTLIGNGRTEEALQHLKEIIQPINDKVLYGEFLVLQSRFSLLKSSRITNTNTNNNYQQDLNSISMAILDLLSKTQDLSHSQARDRAKSKGCLFTFANGQTAINLQVFIGILLVISVGTYYWIRNEKQQITGIEGNNNKDNTVIIGENNEINIDNSKEKCEIPLSSQEMNDFRNNVIGKLGLLRGRPLSISRNDINILKPLVKKVQENICYKEQLAFETSMLYRLYGSVVILGTNDDFSIHPADPFKEGFPYIIASKNLSEEVWQSSTDNKAYNELYEAYENLGRYNFTDKEFLKKYACNMLRIMMIGEDDKEIRNQCKKLASSVDNVIKDNKDIADLKYFLESPVGQTDYRMLIDAVRLFVAGNGGSFNGPELVPQSNGHTLIRYTTIGSARNPSFEWLVDSNTNSIKPYSDAAKVTEQTFANLPKPKR